MLALQAQRTPPADRTQEGQEWICRRAIDVLADIGNPGTNGAVPVALMKTVDDQTASLAVRSAAAAALASIAYPPPPGFNAEPWIKSLGKLAVDCYKGELAAAATQQIPLVPDRLKQELTEIRLGLAGPDGQHGLSALSAANKVNQDLAHLLVTQIDNVIAKCNMQIPPASPPQIVQGTGGEQYMALPPDPQKPLVEAISKAGEELETALQRGPAQRPQHREPELRPPFQPVKIRFELLNRIAHGCALTSERIRFDAKISLPSENFCLRRMGVDFALCNRLSEQLAEAQFAKPGCRSAKSRSIEIACVCGKVFEARSVQALGR